MRCHSEGTVGGGGGGRHCDISYLVRYVLGSLTCWGFCGALGSRPSGEALYPRERRELVQGCSAAGLCVRGKGGDPRHRQVKGCPGQEPSWPGFSSPSH